jgi:protein-tyrosine-phosphatase
MNILFVCTGNTCRSPMAQGMFQKMLEKKDGNYTVDSAGIFAHPSSEIAQYANKQLQKRGVDYSGRKAVQVNALLIETADIVFAMTDNQRRMLVEGFPYAADKIHLLGDYTNRGGDVSDPYGGSEAVYDRCASEIEDMLGILVEMV